MHIYSIYNQEKNNNWEKKNSSIKFAVVFGSFVYFLSFLLWTLLTFLASGQSVIFWVPIFGLDFLHEISVRYYFKAFCQSKISYAGEAHATVGIWRSEDNESVPSFYHVGPSDHQDLAASALTC